MVLLWIHTLTDTIHGMRSCRVAHVLMFGYSGGKNQVV